MGLTNNVSLRFNNYKSFGSELQGFNNIAPINIIIGKNNSGKSALLDIVDFMTNIHDISKYGHRGRIPKVYFSAPLDELTIKRVFPEGTSGGPIGGDYYQYGRAWLDKIITVELSQDGRQTYVHLDPETHPQFNQELAKSIQNPFNGLLFKRVIAERNIAPESEGPPMLNSDGTGVSNLIQYFLHESSADQEMVEVKLLNALNKIFQSDTTFTRIQAKRLTTTNEWEVYLEEDHKGTIALSDSGSGLKTILIVLAQTLLIPVLEKRELNSYVFGFEELENNLHPGLQRRLFGYLRDLAVENNVSIFITTHSNVVIDLFSTDSNAQILHISHDKKTAHVNTVSEYRDRTGLLDDLDVRASDILQSNGVIWVEGPSDRVYINHFISLVSDENIREGAHYQCMFYGGRLLARLTADPKNSEHPSLLKLNRHSCLIMDSDKKAETKQINKTKLRMKKEIEKVKGYVWVTDGSEIENSIPLKALRAFFNKPNLKPIGKFQPFEEYVNKAKPDYGKVFLKSKVLFAEQVCEHITLEMLEEDEVLLGHIKKLCRKIDNWNSSGN